MRVNVSMTASIYHLIMLQSGFPQRRCREDSVIAAASLLPDDGRRDVIAAIAHKARASSECSPGLKLFDEQEARVTLNPSVTSASSSESFGAAKIGFESPSDQAHEVTGPRSSPAGDPLMSYNPLPTAAPAERPIRCRHRLKRPVVGPVLFFATHNQTPIHI